VEIAIDKFELLLSIPRHSVPGRSRAEQQPARSLGPTKRNFSTATACSSKAEHGRISIQPVPRQLRVSKRENNFKVVRP
jgi:hypothetical protein